MNRSRGQSWNNHSSAKTPSHISAIVMRLSTYRRIELPWLRAVMILNNTSNPARFKVRMHILWMWSDSPFSSGFGTGVIYCGRDAWYSSSRRRTHKNGTFCNNPTRLCQCWKESAESPRWPSSTIIMTVGSISTKFCVQSPVPRATWRAVTFMCCTPCKQFGAYRSTAPPVSGTGKNSENWSQKTCTVCKSSPTTWQRVWSLIESVIPLGPWRSTEVMLKSRPLSYYCSSKLVLLHQIGN